MNTIKDTEFLSQIPRFNDFDGIADITHYLPLPDGWALAMADIVDSTGAIASGKYKSVNMAGASVITAVLNALDQLDLPFVFGGDGAFVAVPPNGVNAARDALARVRTWVAREFDLDMRAAVIPVGDIRAAGLDARVAFFQASSEVAYAMFAGDGASWAEDEMKKGAYAIDKAPDGQEPNLFGLSCRWNPVSAQNGQVASIIAIHGSRGESRDFRALVFDILAIIDSEERAGHPIPPDGPSPAISLAGYDAEVMTQPSKLKRGLSRLGIAAMSLILLIFRRFNLNIGSFNIRDYSRDLVQNTDFRKFDDGLKMTVDLNDAQLEKVTDRLEKATQNDICHYGIHTQKEALVTCIVPSVMSRDHMHFVDGADGGYAEAALRLKEKLARAGQ